MTSDKSKNENAEPVEKVTNEVPPYVGDLSGDPAYQELLINYQNARWQECDVLLAALLERYSENQLLLEFKRDFELQTEFRKNEKKFEKQKSKETIIRGSKLAVVVLILGLALVTLIILGFWYGYNMLVQQQEKYKDSQIAIFSTQVSALLQSGQPEKAQEIIDQMQKIEESNPTTIQLATETTELIAINVIYNDAQLRYQNGEYEEALKLFQSIENQFPNYRDVEHMIVQAQNQIEIKAATKDAQTAYDESRWEDAINGFEKIQSLSFGGLDSNLKEKLLNSYLHRIIQMLESNSTTIEDINKAESYYRRAIAMIPQSKIYQSERENLQKISSDLLELKYTQTAEAMISDPNQTLATVNQAVGYLKKASNLNPKNSLLATEVTKISQYQQVYNITWQWNGNRQLNN
jgi:tetratricopeptide (TPR) repeat protein